MSAGNYYLIDREEDGTVLCSIRASELPVTITYSENCIWPYKVRHTPRLTAWLKSRMETGQEVGNG
jgi:hypothetical protein